MPRSSALAVLSVALPLSLAFPLAKPTSTLVYGPGSVELRLIAAKLAARAGIEASLYVDDEDGRQATQCRIWLYGKEYAASGVDVAGNAKILGTIDELGGTLATTSSLCLVCDSEPLVDGQFKTLLSNSPELQRIVLISKMGVTRAKSGPFGLGGDAALLENEKTIRQLAAQRGVDMSVVRVGILKGGGPGETQAEGEAVSGVEVGLAKPYYDGLLDLSTYMMTQSHDKFTLGATVRAGDPTDLPNPFMRAATQSSFEPSEAETNRAVGAAAAVHALSHPAAVELSVGSAKGSAPPTTEEWEQLFAAL